MKDRTEVMEADKRNSSRDEERNIAVPENTNLAEERINQHLHQAPKPQEGVSSEGEKEFLIEESATWYNIGGTAELGKFRDIVEFCHPLGPEIVRGIGDTCSGLGGLKRVEDVRRSKVRR